MNTFLSTTFEKLMAFHPATLTAIERLGETAYQLCGPNVQGYRERATNGGYVFMTNQQAVKLSQLNHADLSDWQEQGSHLRLRLQIAQ